MIIEVQVWEASRQRYEQTELHEDAEVASFRKPYDWPGTLVGVVKGADLVQRMIVMEETDNAFIGFQESQRSAGPGEGWVMARWLIRS